MFSFSFSYYNGWASPASPDCMSLPSRFTQSTSGSVHEEFVDSTTLHAAIASLAKALMVQLEVCTFTGANPEASTAPAGPPRPGRTLASSESFTRPLPQPRIFMTTWHRCLFPLELIIAPAPPSLTAACVCVCVRNMFSHQLPRLHVILHSSLFSKYMMHKLRQPRLNIQGEPPKPCDYKLLPLSLYLPPSLN